MATANNHDTTISILLGNGMGGFGVATNYGVGNHYSWSHPSSIISSDFNNDGKADLATSNNDSTISILSGNGAGSFTSFANFFAPNNSQAIISTDFNNDGYKDLATLNNYPCYAVILLGNGAGNFGSPVSSYVNGSNSFSMVNGDFNGDGKTDLATANYNNDNVSVLLGTGTGSFGSPANFGIPSFSQALPRSITSGDFNADGKLDLATANYNSDTVSVLLGDGTGNFFAAINFPAGAGPNSIIAADFNGDSRPDLAISNGNQNSVSKLLNFPIQTISIAATATTICPGNNSTLTASGSVTYSWSTGSTTTTISVAPTISTVYSVSDGRGCSNTAFITINVATIEKPVICMVTTDAASAYNYNVVYWDKTLYSNVDSFIIYRKVAATYQRIGAVSKNSLSEFIDTAFSIGGPNGGNPQYSSWQYKLAIRDTCGNIGALSPYHQSMFVQQSASNFSWNAYTVETGQTNPVTGYSFLRDDNNTGSWHVLVNTTGISTTDPNYSSYPNANWRIDANGFNCTPTMMLAGNNMQSTFLNSHSNTTRQAPVNVTQLLTSDEIFAYPNPANGYFVIETERNEKLTVQIFNSDGSLIQSQNVKNKAAIDVTTLSEGVYCLSITNSLQTINKKLVIIR
jgi:hypothetical protein